MALSDKNLVSLTAAEHIGPEETGDNIGAKRVALYTFDPESEQWGRMTPNLGLITASYDYIGVTYPNGTTEVYTFKTGGSGGTSVGVLTLVYTDSTKENLSSVTKS